MLSSDAVKLALVAAFVPRRLPMPNAEFRRRVASQKIHQCQSRETAYTALACNGELGVSIECRAFLSSVDCRRDRLFSCDSRGIFNIEQRRYSLLALALAFESRRCGSRSIFINESRRRSLLSQHIQYRVTAQGVRCNLFSSHGIALDFAAHSLLSHAVKLALVARFVFHRFTLLNELLEPSEFNACETQRVSNCFTSAGN